MIGLKWTQTKWIGEAWNNLKFYGLEIFMQASVWLGQNKNIYFELTTEKVESTGS